MAVYHKIFWEAAPVCVVCGGARAARTERSCRSRDHVAGRELFSDSLQKRVRPLPSPVLCPLGMCWFPGPSLSLSPGGSWFLFGPFSPGDRGTFLKCTSSWGSFEFLVFHVWPPSHNHEPPCIPVISMLCCLCKGHLGSGTHRLLHGKGPLRTPLPPFQTHHPAEPWLWC